MKRYMFGVDASDPSGSARRLMDHGYDGVVLGGDARAIEACLSAGLETWLCYGAHALTPGARHAVDPFGQPAEWFGSACPNDRENNRLHMDRAIALARSTGVRGVFVDGARFGSFASTEGPNGFYGCFCDVCMAKMGAGAERIRAGVGRREREASLAWLDFRAACVGEYMRMFAAACRESGMMSAAFVFAPSLARFVGQTKAALAGLDIVAPMLYRDYPHEEGPACMGHEWRAFRASGAAETFGIEPPVKDAFSPEDVGREVAAARVPGSLLLPIIQTEDDRLDETVRQVLMNGADGCGEFMYAQKRIFPST